jgi:hypothetical protein
VLHILRPAIPEPSSSGATSPHSLRAGGPVSWTHDLRPSSGTSRSCVTDHHITSYYAPGFRDSCASNNYRASPSYGRPPTAVTVNTMVESRQCEVLIIVCTFTVVASFFVLLRLWSRLLGRNFGWDDYLIIAALVLLVGDTVGTWTYIILSGTGFHIYDLPPRSVHEQLVALHWNFSAQMIYHPCTYSVR